MEEPDYDYYKNIATTKIHILGGEDSLKGELYDVVNESKAYVSTLKQKIEALEKDNKNCPDCNGDRYYDFLKKQPCKTCNMPPIEIIPEKLFYENRINDITEAIKRYRKANKNIPDEWFKEVLHLMDRQ